MNPRVTGRGAMAGASGLTVLVTVLLVAAGPLRPEARLLVDNTVDNLRSFVDNTAGLYPRLAFDCPFAAGSSLLSPLPGDCTFDLALPGITPSDTPFGEAGIGAAANDADTLVAFADQDAQAASKRIVSSDAR